MLEDIRREPFELRSCLRRLLVAEEIRWAADLLHASSSIHVVGIGSSWNAALGVASLLMRGGLKASAVDASELLHFACLSSDSVLVVLSRSGRSIEIVNLAKTARCAGAKMIAVTNTEATALTQAAAVVIQLRARFDHLISVGMYSLLALAGSFVAAAASGQSLAELVDSLEESLLTLSKLMPQWEDQIDGSRWLSSNAPTYFLARGGSLASCHEARLLWEEAAKCPATALSTGSFRHGSQEMIHPGVRLAMWLHPSVLSQEDLQLARELRSAGVSVALLGTNLEGHASDLVLQTPSIPPGWEFVCDVIPMQLAAERLARLRHEDCDRFKFCSYVVETHGGLSGSPPRPA